MIQISWEAELKLRKYVADICLKFWQKVAEDLAREIEEDLYTEESEEE